MEKLADRCTRKSVLKEYHRQGNQYAYKTGKFTETVFHNEVKRIEISVDHKEVVLGVFFDLEGALDRISFDVMIRATEKHGTELAIFRWICSILESRNIIRRKFERVRG
jgi:hypothetical protein